MIVKHVVGETGRGRQPVPKVGPPKKWGEKLHYRHKSLQDSFLPLYLHYYVILLLEL